MSEFTDKPEAVSSLTFPSSALDSVLSRPILVSLIAILIEGGDLKREKGVQLTERQGFNYLLTVSFPELWYCSSSE